MVRVLSIFSRPQLNNFSRDTVPLKQRGEQYILPFLCVYNREGTTEFLEQLHLTSSLCLTQRGDYRVPGAAIHLTFSLCLTQRGDYRVSGAATHLTFSMCLTQRGDYRVPETATSHLFFMFNVERGLQSSWSNSISQTWWTSQSVGMILSQYPSLIHTMPGMQPCT